MKKLVALLLLLSIPLSAKNRKDYRINLVFAAAMSQKILTTSDLIRISHSELPLSEKAGQICIDSDGYRQAFNNIFGRYEYTLRFAYFVDQRAYSAYANMYSAGKHSELHHLCSNFIAIPAGQEQQRDVVTFVQHLQSYF